MAASRSSRKVVVAAGCRCNISPPSTSNCIQYAGWRAWLSNAPDPTLTEPEVSMLTTDRSIGVTPLSPNIGAEISGIDLTKPLSAQQVQELRDALTRHLVIFFRDQQI